MSIDQQEKSVRYYIDLHAAILEQMLTDRDPVVVSYLLKEIEDRLANRLDQADKLAARRK